MKDKKEEQAKKWRELRKRQRQAAKSIEKFKDEDEKVEWVDGYEPLTSDELKTLAMFLADAYDTCTEEHFKSLKDLGKAYMSGKDQGEIGYLENQCYMAMGREAIYELLLAVLCPGAVDRDYRKYALDTAKEWERKKDESKS